MLSLSSLQGAAESESWASRGASASKREGPWLKFRSEVTYSYMRYQLYEMPAI